MTQRRQFTSPGSLDPPDIGFVAASGVYVAIALLVLFVTVAVANGATAATIFGGVTSTLTGGLIVGSLLASRLDGVPERLGRRWRSSAVLFAVPLGFALFSIASFLSPLSLATAATAAVGSVLTGGAAAGIASMARARYARVMAPGEPILTIPQLRPNRGQWASVVGVLSIVGAGVTAISDYGVGFMLFLAGLWLLLVGVSARAQNRRFSGDKRSEGAKSRPRGRKVFGMRWGGEWGSELTDGSQYLPELQLYRNGIVTEQGNSQRFTPWTRVVDVRLTPEELLIERRRGLDIRCDRAVIEDAETVYEEIERTRGAWERNSPEDEAERVSMNGLGQPRTETEIE